MEMIMVVYACIAPVLVPFCVLFFGFCYTMYKYQLLYVYVNDYQSGGKSVLYMIYICSKVYIYSIALTIFCV